jgi:hypothetical protein
MTDLHPRTHLRATAWVPNDDPHRAWTTAASLAADWIWQRSEIERVPPVLVTNSLDTQRIDVFDEIARAGGHTTPRSRTYFDKAPVLACAPTAQSLGLAMDIARGFSLVAVEGQSISLAEWAAGAGAVNLLTAETSSSAIPDDVRDDLESVIFDGGRNGWTGPDEKAHARRHLTEHVRTGRLTPDQAASYVMSQGVSDGGAKPVEVRAGDEVPFLAP